MECPPLQTNLSFLGNAGCCKAYPSPGHIRRSELLPKDALSSKRQRANVRVRQGHRDPLEASIWDSWQDQEEDWGTEKFSEDELIDILFEDDGSAETSAQNILAIALSLLLVLALGSILWRVALVSLALVSAAVRYSVVGVLLLVLIVAFF